MTRTKRPADKPAKPYPEFPLFPHQTRRWAKKIRGKMCYFGPWDDPAAALEKYQRQRDDLHAGRTPRVQAEGFVVRDLLNHFLTAKRRLLEAGEIADRTFRDYYSTCARLGDAFGLSRLVADLAADDFARLRAGLAETCGPVTLGPQIQRVRGVFKYGYDAGLIDKPVRYGPEFRRPSRAVLRRDRNARGPRMFEAADLRMMIDAAGVPLKAMLLLGANCGYGNADVGTLPLSALDLDGGWATYPRPKTGVARRAALWPETVEALRAALAERPAPKDPADGGLAFVTRPGGRWAKGGHDNPVSRETKKLLRRLGLYRPGLSFYTLRHVFETVAGESRDQVAVDHVMGHGRGDMASVYRERIGDDRLKAVSDHVHAWLFPPTPKTKKAKGK